ncbi:MAG: hypothetical protein NTY36_03120 [Deltaproteobacteria bacterium]|nr:hypothetical protein [Deltaproteobacteria bacterium]
MRSEEEPDPGALGLLPGVLDHGLKVRAIRRRVALPLDAPAHPIPDQAFFVEASFLPEELYDLRGEIFLKPLYVGQGGRRAGPSFSPWVIPRQFGKEKG